MSKVKTRYGEMTVIDKDEIASRSLKMYGEWAQNELNIFREFIEPGDIVFDVGAYIGSHTLAFSNFVGETGKVLAFEPSIEFFEILACNCRNLHNVILDNVGISNTTYTLSRDSLSIDLDKVGNFGGTSYKNVEKTKKAFGVQPNHNIHFTTLDAMREKYLKSGKRISFMKLDIEGMEIEALSEASGILDADAPIIFTEVNSLQAGVELLELLRAFGYEPFGCLTPAFNPNNYYRNSNNMFGNAKETGVIWVHSAKINEVSGPLQKLKLPHLETIDDFALMLYHKPQYPYEVVTKLNSFECWSFPGKK